MRGEIALARLGEHVGEAMRRHRLQRFAEARCVIAIVDDQRARRHAARCSRAISSTSAVAAGEVS